MITISSFRKIKQLMKKPFNDKNSILRNNRQRKLVFIDAVKELDMNTIIYDTELFNKVYAQNNDTSAWRTFLRVYDYRFPIGTFNFCGTRKTKNQIVLLDAGCNNKFNNYIIRRDKKR